MSLWDTLMGTGNNNQLAEKDIAQDMIKDSKFGVTSLAAAAAEAVNPQLREMLRSQLDKAVDEHFELSHMLINKGWYPAHEEPMKQLRKDYDKVQNLSQ